MTPGCRTYDQTWGKRQDLTPAPRDPGSAVDDQGRPIPLSSTLPDNSDAQQVVVTGSGSGDASAGNKGRFAFFGAPFVTRMPAITSSGDWAKKAQPVYAFSPDLKTTYWYSNGQLYGIPKAFKTPTFADLASDPSNPFQPSQLQDSLIGFGLTTATGALGIATGGWAFGAMRTAGFGLISSGATAGVVGDFTTQVADNGVNLATDGSFGRSGINKTELALSGGLAAVPGLTMAVRNGVDVFGRSLSESIDTVLSPYVARSGAVRTAESANSIMKQVGSLPAWAQGTDVVMQVAQPGTRYNMVVSEGQADALMRGKPAFRAWVTPDDVTSQTFARDSLAILPQFKPDVSYVVTVEVTEPQLVNVGTVGPMENLPGGANQVEFLFQKNVKLVGTPTKLPEGP